MKQRHFEHFPLNDEMTHGRGLTYRFSKRIRMIAISSVGYVLGSWTDLDQRTEFRWSLTSSLATRSLKLTERTARLTCCVWLRHRHEPSAINHQPPTSFEKRSACHSVKENVQLACVNWEGIAFPTAATVWRKILARYFQQAHLWRMLTNHFESNVRWNYNYNNINKSKCHTEKQMDVHLRIDAFSKRSNFMLSNGKLANGRFGFRKKRQEVKLKQKKNDKNGWEKN